MKRILTLAAFFLLIAGGTYAQYESDFGINNTGFVDPQSGELIRDPAEINRTISRMQQESSQRPQSAPSTSSSSQGSSSMNIDNTGYDANYNEGKTSSPSSSTPPEAYGGEGNQSSTQIDNTGYNQPPANPTSDGGSNDMGMYSTLLIGLGIAVIVVLFVIVFLLFFLLLRKRDSR